MTDKLRGPDDNHYAKLPIQPIQIGEMMTEFWPRQIIYHLTEALAATMRIGSKGDKQQWIRDLKKGAWLLTRAAEVLENVE